jgi:hypothetical protein
MNAPNNESSISSVTEQLEQQLAAARKDKTLAQVPALRRLRNVVRVYVVLGLLVQLGVLPIGVYLWQTYQFVNVSGGGALSLSTFLVYFASMLAWIPVTWLLLTAYARFLKQFRNNQVRDIEDTTGMILRLFRYNLAFSLFVFVLQLIMFRNHLEVFFVSGGGGSVGSAVGVLIMYFIVRHYVRTAQAELPLLTAAVGENAPQGNYRSWKSLFFIYLAIGVVIVGLGYGVTAIVQSRGSSPGGAGGLSGVEQILRNTSQTLNASLPLQVDSETRLDTTTSGPGRRLTYYYTLVSTAVADIDVARFTEQMKPNIVNNYRTNPSMADLRRMDVELGYVYRDKVGNMVATITVSPRDF